MTKASKVEDACNACVRIEANVSDCNLFVLAVANALGVGNFFKGLKSDNIIARFNNPDAKPPFHYIGTDKGLAMRYADQGHFVLGGLTSEQMNGKVDGKAPAHMATMGHVVVITPGGAAPAKEIKLVTGPVQSARGGYPYCYQGAHNKIYRFTERTQVSCVFPKRHLDEIVYAYVDLPDAQVGLSSANHVDRLLAIHSHRVSSAQTTT